MKEQICKNLFMSQRTTHSFYFSKFVTASSATLIHIFLRFLQFIVFSGIVNQFFWDFKSHF